MANYTARQRLLAAMRREQPDRVPIHVRGVPAWNQKWVDSRHESYTPLIQAVKEKCDMVASWGVSCGRFITNAEPPAEPGIIDLPEWRLHETTLHTPKGPLRSVTQVSKRGHPSLIQEFWVKTEEDLKRFLSIPYLPPEPDARSFFEFDQRIGESAIVMTGLLDPIGYVHDLIGSELLAIWSIENRKVIAQLVNLFTERLYNFVQHLLESGVNSVYGILGEEYAGPPLMSPADFRAFVTVPERQLVQLIHRYGCLVHIHCHGPMDAILEEFVEIGADCLHPIEAPPMGDMPLAEAKRRIGKQVCLEGNIQVGDLYSRRPKEIRAIVKMAIEDAAAGGGFILCPSASPYTPQLEPLVVENYLAMIEAGREYGRYQTLASRD